jgi:DNA-binding SARP family transcriptional activator
MRRLADDVRNAEVATFSAMTPSARDEVTTATRRLRPTKSEAAVHLTLLNAFELRCDGKFVPLPQPAQRLLAFLALRDRPVMRTHVAGTLWLESSQRHAFGSLRSALWRARRSGLDVIEATPTQLRLATSVSVDVRETIAWARNVIEGSTEPGILCHVGDLLPDWYDDWVLVERERVRELRLRALECLCASLADAGKFHRAVEAGLAAIADDPLRESAQRCLITVHLAEGNHAEALRRYSLYRGMLNEQLGIEPSPLMEELFRGLRLGTGDNRAARRTSDLAVR